MKTARIAFSALAAALLALAAISTSPLAAPRKAPEPLGAIPDDPRLAPVKQVQRRAMLSRQMARIARTRAALRNGGVVPKGLASRPPRVEPQAVLDAAKRAADAARAGAAPGGTLQSLMSNVRVNDPSALPDAANHGQAEASMAVLGNNILVTWNDGSGFDLPSGDIQGYGYSTNGGVSFTDGGIMPKPAGWTWGSDPVVTVNEATGTFYVCALADSFNATFSVSYANGIIIVPATFSGGNLVWGAPTFAVRVATSAAALDKEWMVVDSTNDSLYVVYTNFNNTSGSEINFVRSANGTTWSAPVKLSSTAGNGLVHGARVATGPNGEVYMIWSEIGPVDVDFFRIRRSNNAGVSWSGEFTLPSYYANFGTGAPGFNRERGITFPSIAVDRTAGTYRGRVYVTWNESFNWYDDLAGGGGVVTESEPNGTPAQANLFTIGNTLNGTISSVGTPDIDFFKFAGTQGDDIVLRMTPAASLDLAWRLICSDGTTFLAISNLGVGVESYIVFTLPTTATYYVRPAPFSTSGTGTYQIHTKVSPPGPERSRDHRDVMLTTSTNLGQTWSTPVRVNNEPGYYDDWLPEVAVGGNGIPYVIWYDWRDTPAANCGGWSNIYLARSDNGGAVWTEVGLVSDAQTPWTQVASNIAPNQGDYLYLFANNSAVYPLWADGRNGNPDIYTSVIPLSVTPAAMSLVSAVAVPGRVSLTWLATGSEGAPVTVYRRQAADAWSAIGATTVEGNGLVRFEDTNVADGERYTYRIGVREGAGETLSPETEVEIPRGVAFGLRALSPNPTAGELWVSFALPTAEPASLALYDIAGREVRHVELPARAGIGRERMIGSERLPMGVYIVTLRQGTQVAKARVSVVR